MDARTTSPYYFPDFMQPACFPLQIEMEVTEMGLPSIVTDLKVLEVTEIGLPSSMRDLRSIVDRKCSIRLKCVLAY